MTTYSTSEPREEGEYLIAYEDGELDLWLHGPAGHWYAANCGAPVRHENIAFYIRVESAIDVACKIAFAEMWEAWIHHNTVFSEHESAYLSACEKFDSGTRTPQLLEELRRVKGELEGGKDV